MAAGNDFGLVQAGSARANELWFENTGAIPLTLLGLTTNSASGSEYFAITGMPQTVAAGTASNFWVGYLPVESGAHQATFTIATDGLPATFDLRVAGTGIRPGEIWLDKAYLSYETYFGDTNVLTDAYLITNRGEIAFSYSNAVTYANGTNWYEILPVDGALVSAEQQSHTGLVTVAGMNAGKYYVTNTITGTATNAPIDIIVELTINQATQTIAFAAIGDQIATNELMLSATSSPSGLPVEFRVEEGPGVITAGTNLMFTGTGVVAVVASQAGNTNYLAAAEVTNSFMVTKADALVTLTNLVQAYDGLSKSPTSQTSPTGLTVRVTYDGQYTAPKDPGAYAIVATIDEPLYQGSATGTLVVTKAGDVVVRSVSYGESVATHGFTYEAAGMLVLGTNESVVVTNGAAASTEAGTRFGPMLPGGAWLERSLMITNSGTEALQLSGALTGTGAARFAVVNLPASVAAGGSASFAVRFDATWKVISYDPVWSMFQIIFYNQKEFPEGDDRAMSGNIDFEDPFPYEHNGVRGRFIQRVIR